MKYLEKCVKRNLTLKNVILSILAVMVAQFLWTRYNEGFTGEANLVPLDPVPMFLKSENKRPGNNEATAVEEFGGNDSKRVNGTCIGHCPSKDNSCAGGELSCLYKNTM